MKSLVVSLILLALTLIEVSAFAQQARQKRPQREKQPTQRRFTFERFTARHDKNGDGKVERDEFTGIPQVFRQLDRNGDDTVTAEEFRQRTQSKKARQRPQLTRRIPQGVKVVRNLEYANVDGKSLQLDLYLPEESEASPPLLVWIHGGGWTKGSKSGINPTLLRLTAEGYAAASIDYRLDGLTSHPKQIHDCKGAIRWLRANADKYGYHATRIGAGGGSAGGHLVLLLGLSNGVDQLEGAVGGNLDQSSQVHAIVDLYGPSALGLFAEQSERFGRNKTKELMKSASPVTYLTQDDPPLLILHGSRDQVVPLGQSQHMHQQYQAAGLQSTLHILEAAGHGGPQFSNATTYTRVKEFFARHIKQAATTGGQLIE